MGVRTDDFSPADELEQGATVEQLIDMMVERAQKSRAVARERDAAREGDATVREHRQRPGQAAAGP